MIGKTESRGVQRRLVSVECSRLTQMSLTSRISTLPKTENIPKRVTPGEPILWPFLHLESEISGFALATCQPDGRIGCDVLP